MLSDSASVTTDTLSFYPHVPNYVILSSNVTSKQEEQIHDILRITPIYFGIVTDINNAPLASRFSQMILTAADLTAAKVLAQQVYDTAEGHPARSIIIAEQEDILVGIYQDREAVIPF